MNSASGSGGAWSTYGSIPSTEPGSVAAASSAPPGWSAEAIERDQNMVKIKNRYNSIVKLI